MFKDANMLLAQSQMIDYILEALSFLFYVYKLKTCIIDQEIECLNNPPYIRCIKPRKQTNMA